MKKLNFDLRRLSDANLANRGTSIVDLLAANFASAPGLPGLTDAQSTFVVALAASIGGSKVQKALKRQAREDVLAQHFYMTQYLNMICASSELEYAKTGYTVSKARGVAPEVIAPTNLALVNGPNSGGQELSFDRVPGAKSYSYEYTLDPLTDESVWTEFIGTRRKFLFAELEPGKRYWVRAAAIGINAQRVYSDAILSKIVQ